MEKFKKRKRGRLEIIQDILSYINSKGKARKTWIMLGANISSLLMERYLGHLLNSNIIKKEISIGVKSGRKIEYYFLTEKGKDFLKEIEKIKKRMEYFYK